ncbi:MAG: hypothetical protein HOP11_03535 [Saprospiraceae bacterium]|nr:hypothetical protein [Saprospiraceae bacterium]
MTPDQTTNNPLDPNYKDPITEEAVLLPDEIKTIVEDPDIPEETKLKIIASYSRTQIWAYHIPPGDESKKLEEASPGIIAKLHTLIDSQRKRNNKLKKLNSQREHNLAARGQIFAFLIALVAFSSTVYLISIGKTLEGSILGGATILSLVGAFLAATNKKINKD